MWGGILGNSKVSFDSFANYSTLIGFAIDVSILNSNINGPSAV